MGENSGALAVSLVALALSIVINVGGWLLFAGRALERLRSHGETIATAGTKLDKIFQYLARLDRRVAVLEDRDKRVGVGAELPRRGDA